MVTSPRRHGIGAWLAALTIAVAASSTAVAGQQRNANNQYIFPAEGTRVPVAPGDPCGVVVQAIEPGSFWTQNPPPGQTKARPGTPLVSELARLDVLTVVTLLEGMFAGSPDMQEKTRGACAKYGVQHIVIYVVRNDPDTRGTPAAHIKTTNLMFVDIAALAARAGSLTTTPGDKPEAQQRAATTRVSNGFMLTIVAHEMHHAWTGEGDPRGLNIKGGAVEDENKVAGQLGMKNYERAAYKRVDADGRPYVPYTDDTVDVRMPLGGSGAQKPAEPTEGRSNYCCEMDDEDHERIERVNELDAAAAASGTQMTGGGWRIGVTGGFAAVGNSQSGAAFTLPSGRRLTTFTGRPSLIVPSWAFGEAAALLNEVLAAKGRSERVTPLDLMLGSPSFPSGAGIDVGVLLSRVLTRRVSAWGEFRVWTPSQTLSDTGAGQLEATRSSLETAWAGILADTPDGRVTSTVTVEEGGGALVTIGGGLEYCFNERAIAGWHPSVRGGVGFTWHTGPSARATLATTYGFTSGGLPFQETDRLVIAADPYSSFGFQLGGAVRRPIWNRMDLIVEAMVLGYANNDEIGIEATSSRLTDAAGGASALAVSPSLQFGRSDAVPSSLGGSLEEFTTFKGTGRRWSPRLGVGFTVGF